MSCGVVRVDIWERVTPAGNVEKVHVQYIEYLGPANLVALVSEDMIEDVLGLGGWIREGSAA